MYVNVPLLLKLAEWIAAVRAEGFTYREINEMLPFPVRSREILRRARWTVAYTG